MSIQSSTGSRTPVPAQVPSSGSALKKLKKRKRERVEETIDDETSSPKKHKSILSKFEKVSKKAQELAQKREADGVPEDSTKEQQVLRDLVPLPQPAPVHDAVFEPTFSTLPKWLANPITLASSKRARFNILGVDPLFVEKLGRLGYDEALAVQSALVPMLHYGHTRHPGDILVSASTGSGKTLAYLLPIVEALKSRTAPQLAAVIVVPTRKLVDQVLKQTEELCTGTKIVVTTAVGNVPLSTEQKRLVKVRPVYDPARAKYLHAKASKHFFSGNAEDGFFRDLVSMPANHIPQYDSGADILICTPGRLIEHIESTVGFQLRSVEWLVIDEADELLDQFSHWWTRVLMDALHGEASDLFMSYREILVAQMQEKGAMWALDEPARRRREVTKIVLSATITKDLTKLQSLRLQNPRLISIQEKSQEQHNGRSEADVFELPAALDEFAVPVGDGQRKPLFLLHLLLNQASEVAIQEQSGDVNDRPSSIEPMSVATYKNRVLVFTKSHESALRLSHLLCILEPGLKDVLGTMAPSLTAKASKNLLKNFASGSIKILIASDTASRGLDIQNIARVINYDVPSSITSYVHRVGRTARANKSGEAWTFFTKSEAAWFWNQIARNSSVKRGDKKVKRMDWKEREVTEERSKAYEAALAQLQEAVVRPTSTQSAGKKTRS